MVLQRVRAARRASGVAAIKAIAQRAAAGAKHNPDDPWARRITLEYASTQSTQSARLAPIFPIFV
jgi:hypothetical protein